MNYPLRLIARFLAAAAALSLAGCNHAKVTPIEGATSAPAKLSSGGLPPTIYVAPFATDAAQVQVDPGGPLTRLSNGQPLLQRQRGSLLGSLFNPQDATTVNPYQTSGQVSSAQLQAANDMLKDVVKALQAQKIPATSAGFYQDGMTNSLLLTGQFLTIDQGSKTKRIVIGLGVGASNLDAQAQLRDLGEPSEPPLLMFHTSANSGSSPGILVGGAAGAAVTGAAAVGAGVSGYRQSQTGTSSDVGNTADQIAAYIKKYYQQQGWLPADPPSNTTTATDTPGK